MAKTYTWSDLLVYLNQSVPRIIETGYGAMLCQAIQSTVWSFADWKETIGEMPPFHPVSGQQDLVSPFVCLPDDFEGLRHCNLLDVSSDPPVPYEVVIRGDLPSSFRLEIPEAISFDEGRKCLRIFPGFASGPDITNYVFKCTYKKRAEKVTNARMGDLLPFDDDYLTMMVACGHYLMAVNNPGRLKEVPALYEQWFALAMDKAMDAGFNKGPIGVAPISPLDTFSSGIWR